MIDLPNEVILLIFSYLPQPARKALRLASSSLAALGAWGLIDTVYISPYTTDIKVFKAVTSHPVLSRGVKHVVYDTARFIPNLCRKDYYRFLCRDMRLKDKYITFDNFTNTVYKDLANLIRAVAGKDTWTPLDSAARLCQSQSAFRHGQRQYSQLAQELYQLGRKMSEEKDTLWSRVVLAGLTKLGSIQSVMFANSFDMSFYNVFNTPNALPVHQFRSVRTDNLGHRKQERQPNSSSTMEPVNSDDGTWVDLRIDGIHAAGSPLARSWPPQYLRPLGPTSYAPNFELELDDPEHLDEYDMWWRSDTYTEWEFDTILRLLRLAGRLPYVQQLHALGKMQHTGVVPIRVFDTSRFGTLDFGDSWRTLKTLELSFTNHIDEGVEIDLDVLKSFLQRANSLECMSLDFPHRVDDNLYPSIPERELLHKSTKMFPPFAQWYVPRLSTLRLRGISFPYREFVGLFFTKLPQLKSLAFTHISVDGGYWEDIVEGLSHLRNLSDCDIGTEGLLLPLDLPWPNDVPWEVVTADSKIPVNVIDHYVLHGGRHPYLSDDAPNSDSDRYLSRLNATLKNILTEV
ncbi:MAG: hypothetical protein Q9178_005733 [Gyalolechia marmorata]